MLWAIIAASLIVTAYLLFRLGRFEWPLFVVAGSALLFYSAQQSAYNVLIFIIAFFVIAVISDEEVLQ